MIDGTLIATLGLAALVLGALYAAAWWWTDGRAMWAKVLVRGGLPLVFLAMLASLLPTLNASKDAARPDFSHRYEYAPAKKKTDGAQREPKAPGGLTDDRGSADEARRRAEMEARERAEVEARMREEQAAREGVAESVEEAAPPARG